MLRRVGNPHRHAGPRWISSERDVGKGVGRDGRGRKHWQIHFILSFRAIKRPAIKIHGRLGVSAVFEMSMNRA